MNETPSRRVQKLNISVRLECTSKLDLGKNVLWWLKRRRTQISRQRAVATDGTFLLPDAFSCTISIWADWDNNSSMWKERDQRVEILDSIPEHLTLLVHRLKETSFLTLLKISHGELLKHGLEEHQRHPHCVDVLHSAFTYGYRDPGYFESTSIFAGSKQYFPRRKTPEITENCSKMQLL